VVSPEEEKERLRWEGFAEKERHAEQIAISQRLTSKK